MLQAERLNDEEEAQKVILEGWQRKVWTAIPGIIQGPAAADGTVSVQPSIKAIVRTQQGALQSVQLPQLIHCPIMSFGGGGFSITAPVVAGDECLVVFSSRGIDGWWQSGGVQPPPEIRMHDLSDGFVLPGFRSRPRALSGYSPDSLQIRSDDGTTVFELRSAGRARMVVPGGLDIVGDVRVTQSITAGFGTGDQVGLQTHQHAQGNDSNGDAEVPTNAPTVGT